MSIYIIYNLMYNIKASGHGCLRFAQTSSYILSRMQPEAKHPSSRSQDVVDGPGSGALRRAGLRVGAAGGEGGRVSLRRLSAAGLHRGQAVHDAGETLETGGSGCLIAQSV